jgi:hypothetical protein
MDSRQLAQIAEVSAGRYGLTIEPDAIEGLSERLSHINSRNYVAPVMEQHAVEAALSVLFIEAAHQGVRNLTWKNIADLLGRLCPLPPFC